MYRSQGLDALRLLAALMVMWGHGFALHGDGVGYGFGSEEYGVRIFFAISGYLVTQSWQRDPHLLRFLARLALRIMPALAVVVVLTAFVLGPFVTALPSDDYLRNPATWAYLRWAIFVPRSLLLPGVFPHNPGAGFANTSLWTLPMEAGCYLLLAGAGLLRCLNRWIAVAALAASLWGWHRLGGPIMPLFACFAAGVLAAETHLRVRLPVSDPPVDISYGVYLYGFPIQQTIIMLHPGWSAIACLAGALPFVLALAYLSWRLIEAPALRWKPRTKGDRRRFPESAATTATLPT